MASSLPKELWIQIWSDLDFDTLQKTCTLVCKTWFDEIRGSVNLSGEMLLKNDKLKVEDVNAVLSHWEKIKVLRLSKKMTLIGVDLNANPMLRKIIIPVDMSLNELGAWGKATKIWFDPKHFWNPVKLENVVELQIQLDYKAKDFDYQREDSVWSDDEDYIMNEDGGKKEDMEPIGRLMTNLEKLGFYQGADFEDAQCYAWYRAKHAFKHFLPLFRGLSLCLRLQELHLDCHGWSLPDFEDFVDYFPRIKRLKIYSGEIYVNDKKKTMHRAWLGAFPWISSFENLEELELKSMNLLCDDDEFFSLLENFRPLKKLELNACTLIQKVDFWKKLREIMPALKTLVIRPFDKRFVEEWMWTENGFGWGPTEQHVIWSIDHLLEILRSLGNTKNLTITYLDICLDNDFDEQGTEDILRKAMELIGNTFPINSTAFDIEDCRHGFSIKKKMGKATTFDFSRETENYKLKLRNFSLTNSSGKKFYLSLRMDGKGTKLEIS